MTIMEKLKLAKDYLEKAGIDQPVTGVVLGTGLGKLIDHLDVLQTIPYADIPGFPVATVEFHKGRLIFGLMGTRKVLVMQGRFHSYEGYNMQQIVFPIRVMKLLGVQHLLLSNAAGGVNTGFKKGDLVMLDDHINLQTTNPLTGANLDELGGRFPDMSEPYDNKLNGKLKDAAAREGIALKKGVYAAVNGPNLETRAEYRYIRSIGADMVGMSTVPEVIAANHMKLPCAAVSVITDECDPDNLKPVDISEIIAVAGEADERLSRLFSSVIASL
jgi:purine-nucleoside phosphorylase